MAGLDALGNAVHAVLAGEITGLSCVVTGCDPIGVFAAAVAKACGARPVFAAESHPFRQRPAEKTGASMVVDRTKSDP